MCSPAGSTCGDYSSERVTQFLNPQNRQLPSSASFFYAQDLHFTRSKSWQRYRKGIQKNMMIYISPKRLWFFSTKNVLIESIFFHVTIKAWNLPKQQQSKPNTEASYVQYTDIFVYLTKNRVVQAVRYIWAFLFFFFLIVVEITLLEWKLEHASPTTGSMPQNLFRIWNAFSIGGWQMLSLSQKVGIYSGASLVTVKSLSFLKSRPLSRPNAPQTSCNGRQREARGDF